MSKYFYLLLLAMLVMVGRVQAQDQKKYSVYAVAFYNQENLFDTCHDVGKFDDEFLPGGKMKWGTLKYTHKLHNMARVLSDIGTDVLPNVGCAIIGLSEVENDHVLNDLIAEPALAPRGYKYVHVEGIDERGVDCALLYNPKLFTVGNVRLVPYKRDLPKDSSFYTRGFLTVSGELAGDHVTVIVCHWPSPFHEQAYRNAAGTQVKELKDSLLRDDPNNKIIVMGDLNNNPMDDSLTKCLRAKGSIVDVETGDMYNPWYNILAKQGKGSLSYRGVWNLFDQIVMTPNLLNKGGDKDYSSLKYWKNEIYQRDFLMQQSGRFKGAPKRTHAGGVWLDGYSDHLPVVAYFVKEQRN